MKGSVPLAWTTPNRFLLTDAMGQTAGVQPRRFLKGPLSAQRRDPTIAGSPPRNTKSAGQLESKLRVTGGKSPNEYMFSELPQVAEISKARFTIQ
jgi:hypothetical protein